MQNAKSDFTFVPDELVSNVLQYLPLSVHTLLQIEQISKQFNTVAKLAWKELDNDDKLYLEADGLMLCAQLSNKSIQCMEDKLRTFCKLKNVDSRHLAL
jgi:hypothetical protein